jgi:hypothetical protein
LKALASKLKTRFVQGMHSTEIPMSERGQPRLRIRIGNVMEGTAEGFVGVVALTVVVFVLFLLVTLWPT